MSKKAGTALSVMAMVFMGALASPLTVLAADAEETYQPALYATIWALLPPLVAIVLALITKEVYSSLFIGIVTGALIYTGFSPIATLDTVINEGFINSVADAWNIGIFMLADNRMLQLILRNSHIYHTIAELFMMLITIPLFLYLGKM